MASACAFSSGRKTADVHASPRVVDDLPALEPFTMLAAGLLQSVEIHEWAYTPVIFSPYGIPDVRTVCTLRQLTPRVV